MLDSVMFIAALRFWGMGEGCGAVGELPTFGGPVRLHLVESFLVLRSDAGQHALGECGKKVVGRCLGQDSCLACGL